MAQLDFETMFKRYNDENERKWQHDRTETLGASMTFGCLRLAKFKQNKYPPDEGFSASTGYARRGTVMENHYIVPVLLAEGSLPPGAKILYAGEDQTTLIDGRLSATPDGLIIGLERDSLVKYGIEDIESDCIVLEIKTFDPQASLKKPKDQHVGQVNQQFGLIHALTEYRPEWAVILYVNSSDYSDIRPFAIRRDEKIFQSAQLRAEIVYGNTPIEKIFPEGKIKGGGDCQYCAWQKQCKAITVASIPLNRKPVKTVPKDYTDFKELVERQVEASKLSDQYEAEKKRLNEEIKQWLSGHQTGFMKTDDKYSASWSKMAGRSSIDTEAMLADGIDLEKYTVQGEPSERLVVKIG